MKTFSFFLGIVLACCAAVASAQAYKCKQPNGTISFQEMPCESGPGKEVTLKSSPPPAEGTSPSQASKQRKAHPGEAQKSAEDAFKDRARQREEVEIRAYNERVKADNKAIRCNAARQQLGVAHAQRPVYSYDNSGNRKYVEDSDRASVVAAAQQRVDRECN